MKSAWSLSFRLLYVFVFGAIYLACLAVFCGMPHQDVRWRIATAILIVFSVGSVVRSYKVRAQRRSEQVPQGLKPGFP
jgi:hypothetical protein